MLIRASRYLLVRTAMSFGLASSGCSFMFTKGPDVAPAEMTADTPPVTCSGSVVAPVFDTVFTGTHIGGAIWGLTQPPETFGGSSDVRTLAIAADFSLAAVHLASAIYGYAKSDSCREAKARQSGLQAARGDATPNSASTQEPAPIAEQAENPEPFIDYGVLWSAWLAAHEATACPDALRLLMSESECAGAACRAPFLLSSGYARNCSIDTNTRISLHRMRHRWEKESGTTISECLEETYRALTDPGNAAMLQETCSNEGQTEAAFRDAARRRPAQPSPPAPSTSE